MPDYLIMPAADRFVSELPGLTSRHSFSFGRHYDPANVGFGLLVMNNDDVVRPGAGYPTHPHRDVEIVTWVLEGALVHRDTTGAGGVIHPGLVQRLSAGQGVRHSELADEHDRSLRFVQMWVSPDEPGTEPAYQQCDVSTELARGRLVAVASGMPRHGGATAIGLGQSSAAMHVARLSSQRASDDDTAADVVTMPGAPFLHVYVARGGVDVEGVGRLGEGDAVRITDEGGRRVRAVSGSGQTAEVLVWEMHADVHAT